MAWWPGDRVRMTDAYKTMARGDGGEFSSAEHVAEFGESIGVVEGPSTDAGPGWYEVRWPFEGNEPGLRYAYKADQLEAA